MKSEPKAFASLSSGLLARTGAARPAMRPQGFGQSGAGLEDLGWNDMGPEPAAPAAPAVEAEKPPVLVVRQALAESILAPVASPVVSEPQPQPQAQPEIEAPSVVRSVSVATASRLSRETAHTGRAAFTLRLDAERHMKLRIASALAHRSAQQLVSHALDQFLATLPEVDALVAQLPPQKLSRPKGKRT